MAWLDDLLICLRFFSRLPVPESAREIALGPRGLAEAALMAPLAGLVIGLVPAAVLLVAAGLSLPSSVAAILAVTALVMTTGALHEDALADCADGFGGGRTRERKLEIMRDSRIGAFGACAIVLSLLLRVAALAEMAARSPGATAAVVLGAAALSRGACLLPLAWLPPARPDGAGASAAKPETRVVSIAVGIGGLIVVLIGGAVGRAGGGIVAAALGLAAAVAVCRLAQRQIGGQTGDVAGAAQQAVEIAVLLVFSAALE